MPDDKKECFSDLERVFPMGNAGYREITPACFECEDKKECLQKALVTESGIEFRGERLRQYSGGGLLGRLKRWSQKKELSRQMQNNKGKKQ